MLGVPNFVGPKIAHVYVDKGKKSLRRFVFWTCAAFSLTMLFFCLAMTFWGGHLVVLLYGHKYVGNGLVVTLLSINLAVSAVAFSFSRALFAMELANLDFLINFLALFLTIALGLWLV